MDVEVWSDVICPWCYIGKRRFESALALFPHRDEVQVIWRSFELDPSAPAQAEGGLAGRLAAKYGVSLAEAQAMNDRVSGAARSAGLEYRLEQARPGNTLAAHRLLHLAARQGRQSELKEELMAGYFTRGAAIGDPADLRQLALNAGLVEADVDRVLSGSDHLEEVRADESEASELGISGVPFFVLDRRLGVSGAQPPEILLSALEQAWEASHPSPQLRAVGAPGEACQDDSCPI